MKQIQEGFTLIELLVVIAIIGVLASIVLVSFNNSRKSARVARTAADLKQLTLALQMYVDDNGVYPCFDHTWSDSAETTRMAPYVKWPKNVWGSEFHWEHAGIDDDLDLYSISFMGMSTEEAQMLDDKIDNGNLNTGQLQWSRYQLNRLEYAGMDQSLDVNFFHCHGDE